MRLKERFMRLSEALRVKVEFGPKDASPFGDLGDKPSKAEREAYLQDIYVGGDRVGYVGKAPSGGVALELFSPYWIDVDFGRGESAANKARGFVRELFAGKINWQNTEELRNAMRKYGAR